MLDRTWALWLRAILNSKITKTETKTNKTQKCEKHATKQSTKRALVYSIRAETRRRSVLLFDLFWELGVRDGNFWPLCACLLLTTLVPLLLIWELQILVKA